MKIAAVSVLFVIALFLSGCEITQPERFYDKSVDTLPSFICTLTNLQPGQHIVSKRNVILNFNSLNDGVKELHIYLDSNYLFTIKSSPYTIYLDPTSLSEGKHEYEVYVVARNKGIYSAANISELLYVIPFYYDKSPPPDVTPNPIIYKDSHPYLSWNRSNDPNFNCYIISYSNKYKQKISDTIYDQDKTYYLDSSTTKIYGSNICTYYVQVSNGVRRSTGGKIDFAWGTALGIFNYDRFLANNSKGLLYFLNSNTITMISTTTNLKLTMNLDRIPNSSYFKILSLNSDGSKLYIGYYLQNDGNTNINIYDSQTITLLQTINTSIQGYSRIAVARDRIFLVNEKRLYTLNSDGTVTDSITNKDEYVTKLFADESNNLLYAFSPGYITIYNVANNAIKMVKSIQVWKDVYTPSAVIYYDNKFYMSDGKHSILVIDCQTLSVVNHYDYSSSILINDLCLSDNYLYVGISTQEYYTGRVDKFLAKDLSLISSYIYADNVWCTEVPAGGKYIYTNLFRSGTSQWYSNQPDN